MIMIIEMVAVVVRLIFFFALIRVRSGVWSKEWMQVEREREGKKKRHVFYEAKTSNVKHFPIYEQNEQNK